MRKLIVVAVVGLLAQLVDGSLGMGYGATSSSLLVLVGLTPLAASASVHFSELGTNLASGVAHSRLRNVDWPVVARIAGPGAVGAFLGATVLATLSTTWAKPIMSIILAMLGIYILVRFVVGIGPQLKKCLTVRFLAPLGLFAGSSMPLGAVAGVRSQLPRSSVAASWSRGRWSAQSIPPRVRYEWRRQPRLSLRHRRNRDSLGFALALLAGGLIAAPLAAYLIKIALAHLLGVAVGGMILLTNTRTLFSAFDVSDSARSRPTSRSCW